MQHADERTPYVLVDITNPEDAKFLKRAPLGQLILWTKIFQLEDKKVKRLELGFDLETLQSLYHNATGLKPADDMETVRKQCIEASEKLEVDRTSKDELKTRIPASALYVSPNANKENKKNMSENEGAVKAKKEKIVKEPRPAKEKKEKAGARTHDHSKFAAFTGQSDALATATANAQKAYQAQKPNAEGKLRSDNPEWNVSVDLAREENGAAQPTPVSLHWFAAVATGIASGEFYRENAIQFALDLGLKPMKNGVEITAVNTEGGGVVLAGQPVKSDTTAPAATGEQEEALSV